MTLSLNPKMETLFLLMIGTWDNEQKAKTVAELDALGFPGQDCYDRSLRRIEPYYAVFQSNKIDSLGAKQLSACKENILLSLYTYIFCKHPDWFETIDSVSDEEANEAVAMVLNDVAEGHEDIIAALDSLDLSPDSKWQIMVLQQKPKQQLSLAATAVMENLPAFEKAQAKVLKELTELLDRFNARMADPKKAWLLQLSQKIAPGTPVVPTLALPIAVMVLEDVTFYGLLTDTVLKDGGEFTKEDLLIGAKALSEKSKVEILLALKSASLYNLEIAETVGLTAATVSHHMNLLIATGFVDVEKREGKVYYRLSSRGIQRYLTGVVQLLL